MILIDGKKEAALLREKLKKEVSDLGERSQHTMIKEWSTKVHFQKGHVGSKPPWL